MNFVAEYSVTPALQDQSVRQYFFQVLLGRRVYALALLILLTGVLIAQSPPAWLLASFITMVALAFLVWVRAYFQLIRQGRASLRLLDHPHIKIRSTDQTIECESATGVRRYSLEKIDKVAFTRDFVVLISGKLPLMIIPKTALASNTLDFLEQRSSKKPPRP